MDLIDFLTATVELGGSDLHIMEGAPPAARVHGELAGLLDEPLSGEQTRELLLAAMSEQQRAILESELEVDFALAVRGLGRFRANVHYAEGQVEGAFRHIAEEIRELDELGHGPAVAALCEERQGLVLVTGITGSGKSTTMAAMVKRVSERRSGVIITIEQPIEYVFEHASSLIKQREVGRDTGSFSRALRAAMRQDPDVIVVSELRDLETIQTALTAAETGHLVIGTLHTMDAPRTLDRLVDVFPPEQQGFVVAQLANCLVGIVSQHLIRRADSPGRVLSSEVLRASDGVRAAIRDRKIEQIPGMIEIGASLGMHTMDDSLAHLLRGGYIGVEDAVAHARDRMGMRKLAHQLGHEVA